jgi:hypothetical protein
MSSENNPLSIILVSLSQRDSKNEKQPLRKINDIYPLTMQNDN